MDVTQTSSSAFEIVFQYHTSRLHELAQYMSHAADVDCAQPIIILTTAQCHNICIRLNQDTLLRNSAITPHEN